MAGKKAVNTTEKVSVPKVARRMFGNKFQTALAATAKGMNKPYSPGIAFDKEQRKKKKK